MIRPAPTVLIAIGGAMDLNGPGAALREVYRRSGGKQAHLVIIPTASTLADAGQEICQALLGLGLDHPPLILPVRTRAQALDPAVCAALEEASGIFFTGGNQLRLTAHLGGTPVETALLAAYQRGAVVGGTSAGAAVLGKVMLAYGKAGPTPRVGMAQFAPGLGFTGRVIFDQHFRQRDRLGRLIYAIIQHPGILGVGVDENTAAILETQVDGTARLHVAGLGAVTIVDGRAITASDVADLKSGQPAAVSDLRVHILTAGSTYDLEKGTASIPEKILPVD